MITNPSSALLQRLADFGATRIREGFVDYNARFAAVTRRAKQRFEQRDWAGARVDAVERIGLYDLCVAQVTESIEALFGEQLRSVALWSQLREKFSESVVTLIDQELYKTFFNTLTRRVFKTRGVDSRIEFIALDLAPTDAITHPVARHSYVISDGLEAMLQRAISDYRFAMPLADLAGDVSLLAQALHDRISHWPHAELIGLELMQTVFYRERRAYLVGRIFGDQQYLPCVIALIHDERGLRVDAVLTEREQIAVLFGYTRSYFFADLPTVGDAVVFLRSLLPSKPVDELYTVLGRAKQGKTERYRQFFRYLADHRQQQLQHADGERGMVMMVFTLPGYPLVFKLIRDRFAPPKSSNAEQVREKYALVFKHDRVGRLVDAQEFRFLRFPRWQFEPSLLLELQQQCSASISEDGEDIVVHYCYIERRLRPLNLYVKEVDGEQALRAVLDYGQAIKDLARSNIFPGDLLLKNFGVGRTGRIIFYDYDELALVTDCRFRTMPQPRNPEEEIAHEPWFYVHDNDVFPDQFPRFLGLKKTLLTALIDRHGEIFTVQWWQQLQQLLREGKLPDVPPYPRRARLETTA